MTVSIVADGAGERLVFVPKVIRHDARSDASRLNEQGRGSFNRVGIAPRVSTLPTALIEAHIVLPVPYSFLLWSTQSLLRLQSV